MGIRISMAMVAIAATILGTGTLAYVMGYPVAGLPTITKTSHTPN